MRSETLSPVADSPFKYEGSELDLFEKARNWKAYWRAQIRDFVRGDVLEVGAGIGANTLTLAPLDFKHWTCLEPDAALAARVTLPPGGRHRSEIGTIGDLPSDARFDSILYIDVLEHIEDDRAEIARAAVLLAPRGALIVLSPAFQQLFSDFDRSVGHFRRYTRASLAEVMPPSLRRVRLRYLDSVGFLASLSNRALLRQALPTRRQIALWDRVMIPASRVLDPLLARSFGRSVLAVYERV